MPNKKVPGGVTAARGFLAAGIPSGIKPDLSLDLALLLSERPGPIAGCLTQNCIKAAPVILTQQQLKKREGQAFLINSGNANACTGPQGLAHAKSMALAVSAVLQIPIPFVYVGSTGVIGRPLPIKRIQKAVPGLTKKLRKAGHLEAAKAIMTTDTYPKEVAYRTKIGNHLVTVGGMAKGSGMIHPNMATMLAYLTTDAAITPQALKLALKASANQSFNCITVDGDTSTNDSVLCLANGMAGNPVIRPYTPHWKNFQNLLAEVCIALALQICLDGEGCTKLVEIIVRGTKTARAAKKVAESIATSLLVKTALFGEDPNWGRIMAAAGRAGVYFKPEQVDLAFNNHYVVKAGQRIGDHSDRQAKRIMHQKKFTITISLGTQPWSHRLWTTDLSYEYVRINASYTT